MAFEKIRPKVPATETPELQQLFADRNNHLAAIENLDAAIFAAAARTPTYAFIKGISSNGRFDAQVIEAQAVVYELSAYSLDQRLLQKEKERHTYTPTPAEKLASLGEKTLNSILNGKMLNANEKRKLVKAMLPAGILGGDDSADRTEPDNPDEDRPF